MQIFLMKIFHLLFSKAPIDTNTAEELLEHLQVCLGETVTKKI